MHSSQSIIYTILEEARSYVDEPTIDAKYDDDWMVRFCIMPEMANVWGRLSRNYDNPPIIRHTISITEGQEYYVLPPNVGEVMGLQVLDSNGYVTNRWKKHGTDRHQKGPGYVVEGNMLSLRPFPTTTPSDTWQIWYIPSGDFQIHYATDGEVLSGKATFTLTSSPTVGSLDRRENGYVGGILRVGLGSGGGVIEERMITEFDASTNVVTVRSAFGDDISVASGITYEVVPMGTLDLASAVATACAMRMGAKKNVTAKQMEFYRLQYRNTLKTVGDRLANMDMQRGKHYEKATTDSNAAGVWWLGGPG